MKEKIKSNFGKLCLLVFLIFLIPLGIYSCKKNTESTNNLQSSKRNIVVNEVNDNDIHIGIEKGKRKYCKTPPNTTTCCGKGWCVVVSIEDTYDANTSVNAYNYCEGKLTVLNNTNVELFIPYNKITQQTYIEQFGDGFATFAEEDTIPDYIAAILNKQHIIISTGQYPISDVGNGYKYTMQYHQ